MARYFLHLRDHVTELMDPEGIELPNLEAVKNAVLKNARDVMSGDLRSGLLDLRFRIDAENDDGAVVFTLPFMHAVNIISGPVERWALAGHP
jgi:hypothetical protein